LGAKEKTVQHEAFNVVKEKVSGDTKITFYQLNENE